MAPVETIFICNTSVLFLKRQSTRRSTILHVSSVAFRGMTKPRGRGLPLYLGITHGGLEIFLMLTLGGDIRLPS
jgi:hypothetical protein